MNLKENLIQDLENLGYSATFYDDYSNAYYGENHKCNNIELKDVTSIYIGIYLTDKNNTDTYEGIHKTINLPKKKLVDVNYILEKLSNEKIYISFAKDFKILLKKAGYSSGISVCPTTYGIGVFVAVGLRSDLIETKTNIDNVLVKLGIDYKTEYSDAGWVFRYKISKSKENIEKIKDISLLNWQA